jgi:hydrogenase maturation protease
MKSIVLGIGNPIIGDDGVGFRVIEALEKDPPTGEVTFTACDVSGLAILDLIVDYDRAVLVDAIQTVGGVPGTVYRLELADFNTSKHTASAHDMDLPTALDLGRKLNLKIPETISIVAIEIPEALEFSHDLTPPVQAAVAEAVHHVREILAESLPPN